MPAPLGPRPLARVLRTEATSCSNGRLEHFVSYNKRGGDYKKN